MRHFSRKERGGPENVTLVFFAEESRWIAKTRDFLGKTTGLQIKVESVFVYILFILLPIAE